MLRAFSPSGFGSRWLSWENSTSANELRPVCAITAGTIAKKANGIQIRRIEVDAANLVRASGAQVGRWKQVIPSTLGMTGNWATARTRRVCQVLQIRSGAAHFRARPADESIAEACDATAIVHLHGQLYSVLLCSPVAPGLK